jgi:hypothetical protein
MTAARDRTKSAVAVAGAYRRAVPIGMAGCALAAGVLLLGNPFATNPPASRTPRPELRLGTAELSLPEPTATPAIPIPPKPAPAPAPIKQAAAPAFVVPAAPAPSIPAAPAAKRLGGGKRATVIVETLPAKPIIPPFRPKQPAGAPPEPRPTLPLDTEIGTRGADNPAPAAAPAPKTAAASLPRDG